MRALLAAAAAAAAGAPAASAALLRPGRAREPREALVVAPAGGAKCPVCAKPQKVGVVPNGLNEASALAPSPLHAGVYYSINDDPDDIAGEVPLLYAIRETGEVVARFNLTGFDPMNELVWTKGGRVDVEAIQTGWCFTDGALRAGNCIIVGNVGHNCARTGCEFVRKSGLYALWQFEEPDAMPAAGELGTLVGRQLWFRFPGEGENHDVETLLAGSGELLVVTKENQGPSSVYRWPNLTADNSASAPAVLERVEAEPTLVHHTGRGGPAETVTEEKPGKAWKHLITDGAVANTSGVVLLGYLDVLYYPRGPNATMEQALAGSPCHLPHPKMKQSEGVTWGVEDGTPFYLMIGEGKRSTIQKVRCPLGGVAASAAARRGIGASAAALLAAAALAAP